MIDIGTNWNKVGTAIVTGVTAGATKTIVDKQLSGDNNDKDNQNNPKNQDNSDNKQESSDSKK